jgi:glycosyltransferase involved in cell wall biosynthesis
MIAVMPRLVSEEPRTHLLLVGNGDHEPALRDQALRLRLESAVTFVGAVPHERLCPYYACADVHVLPSHTEGLGQVILEAIACNVPSVGSLVGGIPELLGEVGGALFPPGDTEGLRLAVRKALDGDVRVDPDRRQSILARFSCENAGRILLETYRDALAECGNAR